MKILIIRAGALGDTLMLMPSFRGLGKDHEIVFAGRRPGIDYVRPYVTQCVDMDGSPWHRLFVNDFDGIPGLPVSPPDHVVAFLNDPDRIIAGNLRTCFPRSVVNVLPVFPPEDDERHIALYLAQAIRDSGLPIDPQGVMDVSFTAPLMTCGELQINGDGHVVIHPGSGSQKKNYPPAYWVSLIKKLKKSVLNNSKKIVLILGPAEKHLAGFFRDRLDEKDADLKILSERDELLSVLGNASIFVGHDSGVTHLAALLGKQVIALFKDSSIKRWHPIGPNVRIIKNGKN